MLTQKLNEWLSYEALDQFFEYEQTRVEWEPAYVVKDNQLEFSDEIDSCFSRCIALALELELPVGAFIRGLIERENDIPTTALKGLVLNIQDEEKHFKAFENISKTYKVYNADRQQAINYRKSLIHSKAHPLQKSRDLETILFIPLQSAMRYYGSQSLERVISAVSLDEYRHLQYNWEVSHLLGINFNVELENMISTIAKWMFEPLKESNLNFQFWNKRIDDMRIDGKSEILEGIMSYAIKTAPFEVSNENY